MIKVYKNKKFVKSHNN